MLLETGIFMSQAIWLWRVRHVRREAKKAGKSYDDYVSENPSKKIPQSESSETVDDLEACHDTHVVTEKADIPEASQRKDAGVAAPSLRKSFVTKWRDLVLRPAPESQS